MRNRSPDPDPLALGGGDLVPDAAFHQLGNSLDGTQFAEREPAKVFHELAQTPAFGSSPPHRCTSRATKSTGDCSALAPRTFPRPASSARTMI
jgi:hypothetical protein